MRCFSCEKLSFHTICKRCRQTYLQPSFFKRKLDDDFFVFSFYEYDQIKELLNAKYHPYGDKIYKILADLAFKKFAQNFQYNIFLQSINIENKNIQDFSHTAILSKALNSSHIQSIYRQLQAQNHIKYAGKSLDFRKNNPRDFLYLGEQKKELILVDDIVTTGSTLLEAKKLLEKHKCNVHFALCLCDVSMSSNIVN